MFVYQCVGKKVHITGWEGVFPSRLEVPETLDGNPVCVIGEWAFANAAQMEELQLPEGLEELGWYALSGCRNLTRVKLPASLRKLGGSAFQNCSSLKELCLPEALEELGSHFVEGCSALERVEVSWENRGFEEVEGIVYDKSGKKLICAPPGWSGVYTAKPGLERIGGEAFWGCVNLEGVELGESVAVVGNHAFYGCHLKTLTLSAGLEEMGEWAFGRGSFLKELSMPVEVEMPEGVLVGLRRCLEGRELRSFQGSFHAMGKIFNDRQKLDLTFSYATNGFSAGQSASGVYERLIALNFEKILLMILERDAVEGLHTMERLGLIAEDRIPDLQEQASSRNAAHCQLFLMEYLNRQRKNGAKADLQNDKWDIDF